MVNNSVRNEMRKIGYARVSTPTQNLDRQIGALRAERCDKIFREKASGKDIKNRPQLEKAIDELGKGDVLVRARNGTARPDRCSMASISSSASMPAARC